MRLDELFMTPKSLTPVSGQDFGRMVQGGSHVRKAWVFDVQGQPYAAFIEDGDHGDEHIFAFAALILKNPSDDPENAFVDVIPSKNSSDYKYKLAWGQFTSKAPFTVLSYVMAALMQHLNSPDMQNVSFIGSTPRQDEFYRKALTSLAKRMPKFKFMTDGEQFMISKDKATIRYLLSGGGFHPL
jgi:hypothetical protein